MLAANPEGNAAGREDGQAGRGFEEFPDKGGGIDNVLDVVEGKERPLLTKHVLEPLHRRPIAGLSKPERLQDRRADRTSIGKRRQPDEEDPVRVVAGQPTGDVQCESGFADARRAR